MPMMWCCSGPGALAQSLFDLTCRRPCFGALSHWLCLWGFVHSVRWHLPMPLPCRVQVRTGWKGNLRDLGVDVRVAVSGSGGWRGAGAVSSHLSPPISWPAYCWGRAAVLHQGPLLPPGPVPGPGSAAPQAATPTEKLLQGCPPPSVRLSFRTD